MNCLGWLSRDNGQSRVPVPPQMMTGVIMLGFVFEFIRLAAWGTAPLKLVAWMERLRNRGLLTGGAEIRITLAHRPGYGRYRG